MTVPRRLRACRFASGRAVPCSNPRPASTGTTSGCRPRRGRDPGADRRATVHLLRADVPGSSGRDDHRSCGIWPPRASRRAPRVAGRASPAGAGRRVEPGPARTTPRRNPSPACCRRTSRTVAARGVREEPRPPPADAGPTGSGARSGRTPTRREWGRSGVSTSGGVEPARGSLFLGRGGEWLRTSPRFDGRVHSSGASTPRLRCGGADVGLEFAPASGRGRSRPD